MKQMTAAHRSLPFGTWVSIENLENGRTARVRINDRGPVSEERILDMSDAAARVLGVKRHGVIPIRLRVIRPPEANESEPEAAGVVK
jgi:rare lipoprotein A